MRFQRMLMENLGSYREDWVLSVRQVLDLLECRTVVDENNSAAGFCKAQVRGGWSMFGDG